MFRLVNTWKTVANLKVDSLYSCILVWKHASLVFQTSVNLQVSVSLKVRVSRIPVWRRFLHRPALQLDTFPGQPAGLLSQCVKSWNPCWGDWQGQQAAVLTVELLVDTGHRGRWHGSGWEFFVGFLVLSFTHKDHRALCWKYSTGCHVSKTLDPGLRCKLLVGTFA